MMALSDSRVGTNIEGIDDVNLYRAFGIRNGKIIFLACKSRYNANKDAKLTCGINTLRD